MEIKELLKKILTTPGVSGREDEVAKVINSEFSKYCDESYIHQTNSVVGLKKATRTVAGVKPKKLMFAAHLDQIGLVITKIEKGGFLRISGIGYDYKVLTGQPVIILGKEQIRGVISATSISTTAMDKWEKSEPMDDLYIDTALDEEVLRKKVRVGDLVKIEADPLELKGNFYSSPVLDDRACVVAMILGMEKLVDSHHDWDIYFVATCGEESTGKGARATAWDINPDVACAMDVTFATQLGASAPLTYPIGKGLTISVGPVFDKFYNNKIEKICNNEKIPFVYEPDMVGFGTDAASIRRTRGGIPVSLVSLAIKSMHTPVEIMSLDDLKQLGRFVASYSANIHKDYAEDDNVRETL